MTENKITVEKYMEGFRRSDHQMILECLTDDVVWRMPGVYTHHGKGEFDKEIENDNFVGSPKIQIKRLIEENDIVVAEGAVQGTMKNGNSLDAVFCDVFEMTGGKIRCLTSYLMTLTLQSGLSNNQTMPAANCIMNRKLLNVTNWKID